MVIVGLSQLPQAVFSRAVYLHVCVYVCVSGPFTGLTAAGGWLQIQSGKTTKLLEYMLGLASIAFLEHKMFVFFLVHIQCVSNHSSRGST